MRRRSVIVVGTALLLLIGVAVVNWPLTDDTAVSIAKVALMRDRKIDQREPIDVAESNGIKLVSFGIIDGYDYVVQVRSRWAAGEIHRMPVGGG